jgi:hypothetical protein
VSQAASRGPQRRLQAPKLHDPLDNKIWELLHALQAKRES